ncbi:hypothetical protein BLGI_2711 [Brevibacillus laterosporus GI-9]|nr:hypothetical protein BLGI_2711 [Brevibacillus laterosporus GI-9]
MFQFHFPRFLLRWLLLFIITNITALGDTLSKRVPKTTMDSSYNEIV